MIRGPESDCLDTTVNGLPTDRCKPQNPQQVSSLSADALAKVYEDLGPDAEDIVFRMAVRERRDEQLEQAHRDAGKLGEREDHYIAVKSVESYEQ
jgi:hypothetical protein